MSDDPFCRLLRWRYASGCCIGFFHLLVLVFGTELVLVFGSVLDETLTARIWCGCSVSWPTSAPGDQQVRACTAFSITQVGWSTIQRHAYMHNHVTSTKPVKRGKAQALRGGRTAQANNILQYLPQKTTQGPTISPLIATISTPEMPAYRRLDTNEANVQHSTSDIHTSPSPTQTVENDWRRSLLSSNHSFMPDMTSASGSSIENQDPSPCERRFVVGAYRVAGLGGDEANQRARAWVGKGRQCRDKRILLYRF